MNLLEQLKKYIGAGIAILPLHAAPNGRCTCGRPGCSSAGKHPRLPNGKDGASLDPVRIEEWVNRWPEHAVNWGGRPPKGLIVLDVDPRHDGDLNLAKVERKNGSLGNTLTCLTGGGGVHLWVRLDGSARGQLCPGVDIKVGATGYVVLPPSTHAEGAPYTWVHTCAAARAPKWLKNMLNPPISISRPAAPASPKLDPLVEVVAKAQPGNRNRALFWAASKAVADGLDTTPLLDTALSIGLTTHEAAATIRSAHRRAS